jgi:2-polyprenyl-3-methyl-5-hydroxy-6-metoxy-1,4-benzoquinol methylase
MELAIYEDIAHVEESNWWYRARRRIIASIISELSLPNKAKILEVGCGPGGNLEMLSAFGTVCAVEPYEMAADIARSRGSWLVKSGSLPNNIGFDESFDLIVSFDVMEHIENDLTALKALRLNMTNESRLFITVPAYQWLWSDHDVHAHHFRRYTRMQLNNVLKRAGFTIERSSYFNSLLFPLIATVKILQNVFGMSRKAEKMVPNQLVNNLLENIFSMESKLLKYINLPFGVSVLSVVKRNDQLHDSFL